MSKPVSIHAKNVKEGDIVQMDLGVRQWGKVTRVARFEDMVHITTDSHIIGALNLHETQRVTVKRAPVMPQMKVGS